MTAWRLLAALERCLTLLASLALGAALQLLAALEGCLTLLASLALHLRAALRRRNAMPHAKRMFQLIGTFHQLHVAALDRDVSHLLDFCKPIAELEAVSQKNLVVVAGRLSGVRLTCRIAGVARAIGLVLTSSLDGCIGLAVNPHVANSAGSHGAACSRVGVQAKSRTVEVCTRADSRSVAGVSAGDSDGCTVLGGSAGVEIDVGQLGQGWSGNSQSDSE